MTKVMITSTIRLTESEYEVLRVFADEKRIPLYRVITLAAIKMAQHYGADPRAIGGQGTRQPDCSFNLTDLERAALVTYQQRNEYGTLGMAARAAMRVGLIERGDLTLPPGDYPDQDSALKGEPSPHE